MRCHSFAAFLLLIAGLAWAQPPGPAPMPSQKLEALRIWRLTQELNLSEDQSGQFFPKLTRLRELRHDLHDSRRALMKDLGVAVKETPLSADKLRLLLDSLETLDDNFHVAERKLRSELNDILTIEQQARFVLFTQSFEKETRKLIEQMRQDRGGRNRGGRK